jgi:protoporphyrinogen oxidase
MVTSAIDPQKLLQVDKCTKIKYKDKLVDFPFQKNIHQLDKEEFIDCLYDLFVNETTCSSNFKEMLYEKFGRSIAEKFLIPYNEKLYACDLNKLDKDAMGRFFPYAEKEDIIRNFKRADNGSYNGQFVYPQGGAIEYIHSIASHVDMNKVRLNCKVNRIDPAAHEVITDSGEHIHYDRLISTMPFVQLLDSCGMTYAPDTYSWNKVLVFNLGFDRQGKDTETHWIYFPEDKYCFYRVGFYSNILQANRLSLYVELGFSATEEIDVESCKQRVLEDLKTAGIIEEGIQLVDSEAIVMNPAYVHISKEAEKDIQVQSKLLEDSNIYSIGRYGGWCYCSIEDNILQAKALAERL